MSELDEPRLIARAQQGDREAFGVLYDRYVGRIYGYAYRQTQDVAVAQDITAVSFEKALHHIGSFSWQDKSVVAWLYRIAHNEAMQHHRRQRWRRPLQWLQGRTGQRGPETAVLRHEHHTALHTALRQLAKQDQDVVMLRFFEELTTDEIAAVLGCTPDNVYVRLHRALKRLRRQMEKLDPTLEVDYVA